MPLLHMKIPAIMCHLHLIIQGPRPGKCMQAIDLSLDHGAPIIFAAGLSMGIGHGTETDRLLYM